MAELNLKQIADKLNQSFESDSRRLIFWYDENGEFAEDIDALELKNAKVYKLEENNQIYTKYFFEYEDKTTNYLVYAPFAKPDIYENHLEDMLLYSPYPHGFFADRISLICADLGIEEEMRPIMKKYKSFFANQKRTEKFNAFEVDVWDEKTIKLGIMAAICGTKTISFEEMLRVLLTDDLENNKYLAEFETYGLTDDFWHLAQSYFGSSLQAPILKKFVTLLFLTYTSLEIKAEMPKSLQSNICIKSGTALAFLDDMMNNEKYAERFDELSSFAYGELGGDEFLEYFPVESIILCDAFKEVDNFIIKWITERLEAEDTAAKLFGNNILQVCEERKRMHFGKDLSDVYSAMEYAYKIIYSGRYEPISNLSDIAKQYTEKYFENDRNYRLFYFYYDRIEDNTDFEKIRELVENIYTNDYLQNICTNWTKVFADSDGDSGLPLQIDFWRDKVDKIKERVVVFISDAMRYEVGVSLFEKLNADEKCAATLSAMQSVLPSITSCGMAALLPHSRYELTDDYKMLVDGKKCASTNERQRILREYNPKSLCINYDTIRSKNTSELKELVSGLEVIYIYHDQIDTRGDKKTTENEVFNACCEAINEIAYMIRRLTGTNVTRFLVTADHGFIYKRDPITVSDKIDDVSKHYPFSSNRYAVTDSKLIVDGVSAILLKTVQKNDDSRYCSYPIGSEIFKETSSGMNYGHGGCSPLEMIIPLIDVKTEKSKVKVFYAEIAMMTNIGKITNLTVNLEFFQRQPVTDVVKPATYHIYFEAENGERVSNENQFYATSTDVNPINTKCKLRFSLKNRSYKNTDKYYLVIMDEEHNIELSRTEFTIDIASDNN